MSTLLIWVGVVGGVGSVFFAIVKLPSPLLGLVGVPVLLCIAAVMIQAARDVAHGKLTKRMLILLLAAGVSNSILIMLLNNQAGGGTADVATARPTGSTTTVVPSTSSPTQVLNSCAAGGRAVSVENHDSGLYLNNEDRLRMGSSPAATKLSVRQLSDKCQVRFDVSSGNHAGSCVDFIDGTVEVAWSTCSEQGTSQYWISEAHWNYEGVEWERFHALQNDKLCLQQAGKGGVGELLVVKECDDGWLQQWKITVYL